MNRTQHYQLNRIRNDLGFLAQLSPRAETALHDFEDHYRTLQEEEIEPFIYRYTHLVHTLTTQVKGRKREYENHWA